MINRRVTKTHSRNNNISKTTLLIFIHMSNVLCYNYIYTTNIREMYIDEMYFSGRMVDFSGLTVKADIMYEELG